MKRERTGEKEGVGDIEGKEWGREGLEERERKTEAKRERETETLRLFHIYKK